MFNHYSGTAGVPLGSIFQRIAASIYINEPRLLNTGVLTGKSKLLLRRDLKSRVEAIAPFLDVIGDPYLISVGLEKKYEGFELKWIDASVFSLKKLGVD